MHILTKVFVLIASILSVVMAALAVSYSANSNAIKAAYSDAMAAKTAVYRDLKKARKHMCRVFHTSAFLLSAAGRELPGLQALAAAVSKDPSALLAQEGEGRPMFSGDHHVDWEAFQAAVYASVAASADDIHLCFDADEILAFPMVD